VPEMSDTYKTVVDATTERFDAIENRLATISKRLGLIEEKLDRLLSLWDTDEDS
jgi:hypothetical protein